MVRTGTPLMVPSGPSSLTDITITWWPAALRRLSTASRLSGSSVVTMVRGCPQGQGVGLGLQYLLQRRDDERSGSGQRLQNAGESDGGAVRVGA